MLNLELASTEHLLRELMTRYQALVVLGIPHEDLNAMTEVIDGPAHLCAGMVLKAHCGIVATLSLPLDQE